MNRNQPLIQRNSLQTAVLFLVFNRIEPTKKVFDEIKRAKPSRLYIAADGARPENSYDSDRVKAVREYVITNIDWNCHVQTLFRDENLGCRVAISEAIDWFFGQEEMGIILEDDCLPSPSFFQYCNELLVKYRDNRKVWHIGGSSFIPDDRCKNSSYYFSRYNHIWGWATWRDRWEKYSVEINDMRRISSAIKKTIPSWGETNYWLKQGKRIHNNHLNSWDYQYTFSMWENNGIAILPCKNLVSNIGFSENATHTTSAKNSWANLPINELEFPLVHPDRISADEKKDRYMSIHMFDNFSIYKILRKIREHLNEMSTMR